MYIFMRINNRYLKMDIQMIKNVHQIKNINYISIQAMKMVTQPYPCTTIDKHPKICTLVVLTKPV